MAPPVRSSPVAALGALVAALAIGALGQRGLEPAAPVARESRRERPPDRVDLNTADARALETLPRVGPALAARIVAHRDAHGPFESLEALDEISGVGPATLAAIREHVTISMPPRDRAALRAPRPTR